MLASCFVQPLDLVKTRIQVMKSASASPASVMVRVVRHEGFLALYSGLSAALLRQATYTTTRLGIYTWLFETFSKADGTPPSLPQKAAMGMTAGVIGSFVGTPAEVGKVFSSNQAHHHKSSNDIFPGRPNSHDLRREPPS